MYYLYDDRGFKAQSVYWLLPSSVIVGGAVRNFAPTARVEKNAVLASLKELHHRKTKPPHLSSNPTK